MKFQNSLSFDCKNIIRRSSAWGYPALIMLCLMHTSCIKKINLYQNDKNDDHEENKVEVQTVICETDFFYPFDKEVKDVETTITIHTRTKLPEDINSFRTEIPPLKYNKSWLFMLTQDDCKQAAFSCTWAAINGQALSDLYYYDLAHVQVDDFPPDAYYLGKTLGCTDGAENEVRFSFTTTLAPEEGYMNGVTKIGKGYTDNYYRFFMKSGLLWGNVKEMLNYGIGIAYHDVMLEDVNNEAEVLEHLKLSRQIILDRLLGRDCKMLARPNGNNTYINAGIKYAPIQTMTMEAGGTKLYPSQATDLFKVPVERVFYHLSEDVSSLEQIKEVIQYELSKPINERSAIYLGVHGTDRNWVNLLVWLNDEYGKNGADNMWMPNQEEYYEYAHYRRQGLIDSRKIDDYTLEVTVALPCGEAFYYPSITVNLYGIEMKDISSIDTDDNISGFSYTDFKEKACVMLNIDCRKYLTEHAENFVKRYEANTTVKANKADAVYFVKMLKESKKKDELLKRIE